MSEVVRVGVAGGGLVGQTVHLPLLAAMSERFQLVAVADPSERVRHALEGRFPGTRAYADWREMIGAGELDAVVVCSPHSTHAEIAMAALDAGLHALVEKPLCISVEDADRICARRDQTKLVVQVGYMKRYDAGFRSMIDSLPDSAENLRLVEVVTRDPGMARAPFVPRSFVRSDDVPEAVMRAGAEHEREQVEAAVGVGDDASVWAYSYTYLACLVHDINLIHGMLAQMGVEVPLPAIVSSHWADGKGANVAFRLPAGGIWNCSWLLLEGLEDFVEDAALYFGDRIEQIRFGPPYFRQRPTTTEGVSSERGFELARTGSYVRDAFEAELEHFHSCIADGSECLTPPEQARLDLIALRDAFLVRQQGDESV